MQARGFLNYRSKYCWPKVIYCICQPNELWREIKKKTGRAKQKRMRWSHWQFLWHDGTVEQVQELQLLT